MLALGRCFIREIVAYIALSANVPKVQCPFTIQLLLC